MRWWKWKPRGRETIESLAEAEARFRRENPVEQVCAGLRDENPEVRRDAALKLARLRDPKAMRPLCEALAREVNDDFHNHNIAVGIIDALAAIGGSEVEDLLCSLLKEEKSWQPIRVDTPDEPDIKVATQWVAPALVELGGVDLLLRGLLDALADERQRIREHAAHEFADIAWRCRRDDDDDDDDECVTLFGEGVLTDLHRESILGPLCSALADESAGVRAMAVMTLGDLGNTNALDNMLACLRDEDEYVRSRAARALGDLGDVRAVESLQRFIDADSTTSSNAEAAGDALYILMER